MSPFTYGNLTPLGPPTTWVHILVETLVETTEYGMKKEVRSRRKH